MEFGHLHYSYKCFTFLMVLPKRMPDVVELISPQALMFSPNSPGTDTMDLHDSLQSGSVMVRSVVFLILKQILKNPDTYIFSIELLCFVGDSPQGGGMASRAKSPSSGLVRISGESLKRTTQRQFIRGIFEPTIVFRNVNCSRGNNA